MGIQIDSVVRVLDELKANESINDNQYDILYNMYVKGDGQLVSSPVTITGQTSSSVMNGHSISAAIDIIHIFKALDSLDDSITRKQSLNDAIIKSVSLESNKAYDNLKRCEKKISNKMAYVCFETFRDGSSISDDIAYDNEEVYFDKYIEAIKLSPANSLNILISSTGERTGNISILKQYAGAFSIIKSITNTINNAIDPSRSTYWHECIEVDSPIAIPFSTDVSSITRGAVCEILVSLDSLSEINEINLTPFTEYPMDIIEISYSSNDTDTYEEFIPIVFKAGVISPINKYLENKTSKDTVMFQFDNIKASRVKIVLNQQHYAPNSFITTTDNLKANGLFIVKDKTELINTIMKPINDAIINETFDIELDRVINQPGKLQYEYGLYNIGLLNNQYRTVSEYISTPLEFPGLATIVLETNEEHYIFEGVQTTSIEYEFILRHNNSSTIIPILPKGSTYSMWELLHTEQDTFTNKITATLRFEADKSNITDNIKLYKDGQLVSTGFVFNSSREIEFVEFDPKARYSITYKLNDQEAATQYKIPTFTEIIELMDIRLKATLRQNSRNHTCVTPILYDYTVLPIDVPVPVGQRNELVSLLIIPQESRTRVSFELPILLSDVPVLMEILISQNPIEERDGDLIEVDEYIEI